MVERCEEWVTAPPAPPLRPFIEQYCGYRLTGFPPAVHRGLPSRHMTFIVSIGDDIDVVAQTDPAQPPRHYACVLSGLQASSALISHSGDQEGVAIELTPLGSRALFGMPAGELWNTSAELGDVVGATGRELWERLQTGSGWRQRFAVCDTVLGRLTGDRAPAPELRFAWETVVASRGEVSVRDLAEESGWSRQHLARRFRDEFGLSPKLAARVVRFERAQRMLRASPPFVSIAQVAAACGYYDQSHLTRDFVALAGCTPTELLAGDVPSVQDADGEGGASSPYERHHHDNDSKRLAVPRLP
ncbi:helix-turn-helix transcriptional regulator [Streptomyces sp. FZ201]|uniref:helix-turn-helix transcriptional regulator n=1 Tax=Streptomyces sp. FZ201 TaxID=3057122 RepID=UPI0021BEE151|nr:helix-turn-helix transcriptional regulator [Streptomyces sp. FZ201]